MLPLPAVVQLLDALEQADPVAAEIVRMRVFAGLSVAETAQVLGIPLRTAQRKWTIGRGLARAWVAERMDLR
jgi:DNA-directed RNA polymerase specialized sigma24 family protein